MICRELTWIQPRKEILTLSLNGHMPMSEMTNVLKCREKNVLLYVVGYVEKKAMVGGFCPVFDGFLCEETFRRP